MDVVQDVLFEVAPFATTARYGYSPSGILVCVEVACHDEDGALRCLESAGGGEPERLELLLRWGAATLERHLRKHALTPS